MIIEYIDGDTFLEDNIDFLNSNEYLATFFKLNAVRLTRSTLNDYALRCEVGEHKLLTLKMNPYSTLFFGNIECVSELISFMINNGYELDRYMCELSLGNEILKELNRIPNIEFYESLSMDFMKATERTEPSSMEVEIPKEDDIDEIVECVDRFCDDCGISKTRNRDFVVNDLPNYRIIRKDGKIVSMGKIAPSTSNDLKVSEVYTRDEYRGQGLARKVVNSIKNEILDQGKNAVLSVDRKNPISNHLYASLGYKRIFSQSEYRKK